MAERKFQPTEKTVSIGGQDVSVQAYSEASRYFSVPDRLLIDIEEQEVVSDENYDSQLKLKPLLKIGDECLYEEVAYVVVSRSHWSGEFESAHHSDRDEQEGQTEIYRLRSQEGEELLIFYETGYKYEYEGSENTYMRSEGGFYIVSELDSAQYAEEELYEGLREDRSGEIVLLAFEGESETEPTVGGDLVYKTYRKYQTGSTLYQSGEMEHPQLIVLYPDDAPESKRRFLIRQMSVTEDNRWRTVSGLRKCLTRTYDVSDPTRYDEPSAFWQTVYFAGLCMRVGAVLAFFVAIVASFSSGNRIFYHQQSVTSLADEDGLPEKDTFVIEDVPSVYSLRLGIQFNNTDNSACYVAAELLDENGNVVNLMAGDFWEQRGYSGGEHWHEKDVKTSHSFRVERPGTYYVRLHPEYAQGGPAAYTGTVWFDVRKQTLTGRHFYFLALLLIIFGMTLRNWKKISGQMSEL